MNCNNSSIVLVQATTYENSLHSHDVHVFQTDGCQGKAHKLSTKKGYEVLRRIISTALLSLILHSQLARMIL